MTKSLHLSLILVAALDVAGLAARGANAGSEGSRPAVPARAGTSASSTEQRKTPAFKAQRREIQPVIKSDAEWQQALTAEQYRVLRQKGTERAFTGAYWNHHEPGTYRCAGCGLELFNSRTKYDSGTGWPSFWAPVDPSNVQVERDVSLGMVREEVVCARCGGHLGHRFDDGPKPTGQRYCMNSAALDFEKSK